MTATAAAPTGAPVAQRLPRLESLTGLRWWAAFVVFVHHFNVFAPIPLVRDAAVFGTTGVSFFFVLSGFVLTWSYFEADTAPRFYWRRFARIWPLHLVTTLLAIPVFYGTSAAFQKPFDLSTILLTVVLLQAWAMSPAVYFGGNPASWSLSDEAFFYSIFPAVIRRFLRRRVWQLALIALACVVLTWVLYLALTHYPPEHRWVTKLAIASPLYRVLEFLLGMATASAIRLGWRCRVPVWAAIALLAVVVLALTAWAGHPWWSTVARPVSIGNQVTGPVYALIIAAVATRDLTRGGSWFSSPVLVRLGQWSYAFYLVHATIIYSAMWAFGKQGAGWSNAIWLLPLLPAGIAAAAALYHWVEHPVERRLRAMLPPAPRQPVAGEPSLAGQG